MTSADLPLPHRMVREGKAYSCPSPSPKISSVALRFDSRSRCEYCFLIRSVEWPMMASIVSWS
jgi:hypothetical protein